jgi:hypothetical protein
MAETPDIDALARRYLELWQDHLRGLAADGDVAEMTARTVELMNAGLAAWGGEEGAPHGTTTEDQRRGAPGDAPGDAPGTAAPGPAPGHPGPDLGQLLRRLEAVEGRLAQLEAAAAASRGGAGGGPGRRRS